MKVLAIIFIVFYSLIAFWLLAISAHADYPFYLPFLYLVISISLIWAVSYFTGKLEIKYRNLIILLIGLGIASIGVYFPFLATDLYLRHEKILYDRIEINNFQDRLLLSEKGNPVGVIFSYSVNLPEDSYFYFDLTTNPEAYEDVLPYYFKKVNSGFGDRNPIYIFGLYTINRSIKPDPYKNKWKKDVYTLQYATLPNFLEVQNGKICIRKKYANDEDKGLFDDFTLKDNQPKIKYRFGAYQKEGRAVTNQFYNLRDFYNSAVKEMAEDCQDST